MPRRRTNSAMPDEATIAVQLTGFIVGTDGFSTAFREDVSRSRIARDSGDFRAVTLTARRPAWGPIGAAGSPTRTLQPA